WPPPIAVMVMSPCYRNGRGARGWGPYRTGVAPGVPTGGAAGDASGEATGVAGTGVDSGVAGTGDGLAATVSPRQSNRVFQVWKYMSGTYPWISGFTSTRSSGNPNQRPKRSSFAPSC